MVHAHVCGGSSGDSDPAATSDHVRRRRLRADAGGGVDAADIARMGWCTRARKDFLIECFSTTVTVTVTVKTATARRFSTTCSLIDSNLSTTVTPTLTTFCDLS